jgi:hypothetical protein
MNPCLDTRGKLCEFPVLLRETPDWVCPKCGTIWAVMEGDTDEFYWESIGQTEEL